MRTAMRFSWPMTGAMLALGLAGGPRAAQAQSARATASSQWGPGFGAAAAADGIAHQHRNFWQTLDGQDKGAWWQQDLSEPVAIQGVKIDWADSGPHPWVRGGCTYVVGQDGRRYESRLSRPENVELSEEDGRAVVRISGVTLSAGRDEPPVATENWTLSAPGDGSQLVWRIVRRWERDFTSTMSGSPALFFAFHVPQSGGSTTNNSATSTIWYDPLRIAARPSVTYAECLWAWCCRPRALSKKKPRADAQGPRHLGGLQAVDRLARPLGPPA